MSDVDTALPPAEQAAASGQDANKALTDANRAIDQDDAAGEQKPEAKTEPKPEKTPEQREIDRLRRGIDRRTRQLAEARAKLGLTQPQQETHNREQQDDSEPLSLTRAQIAEMVKAEAAKLAPTLRQQDDEAKRRAGVAEGLAKSWGRERFDELSESLDAAFDGLADAKGLPRPAVEAIFEADDPKAVIEYLADPDNDEEAEAISRMGPVKAGKAIAQLEAKLKAEAAKAKPQASKAPKPLENVRGSGPSAKALADLDGEDFAKRRREQIKNRR